MAVLSRTLLAGPVLSWTLLAIGLAEDRSPASRGDAILGVVVITFIPVVLGTVHLQRRLIYTAIRNSGASGIGGG